MESTFFKTFSAKAVDIPDLEYHGNKDYLSASSMKLLKRSPLHYINEQKKETEAMAFGSAYHCLVLEPEKFDEQFYVFDETSILEILIGEGSKSPRATNKYKEWKELQFSKADGKTIIEAQEYAKMEAMKNVLFSHPFAKSLLTNGIAEQAIFAEFETGSGEKGKIKIKPDYMKPNKRVIADLKTCVSAELDEFTRHSAKMNYHIQAALYSDVVELMHGDGLSWRFIFIAQEKEFPYAFNLFEASPQFIAQGRYEYEMLTSLWLWCKENNKWPGYQCFCENKYGVMELNLPSYANKPLDYFTHKTL